MKKFMIMAALAAAALVAVPVAGQANTPKRAKAKAAVVVPVNNRAECLLWSERSANGVRLPCIPIWYQWKSTDLVGQRIVTKKVIIKRWGNYSWTKTKTQVQEKTYTTRDRLPFGAAYVMGSTFCSAAHLIIAAAIVNHQQNRELYASEAHEMGAGCFLPILGPLLVRQAHAANPQWDAMLSKK